MVEAPAAHDVWAVGAAYQAYVGRWSRLVAREFVRWLGVPPRGRWLDVGCGTGTLVEAIAEQAGPRAVLGLDRSNGFVGYARARATAARTAFQVGDAQALPVADGSFDAVVSGLVLNFPNFDQGRSLMQTTHLVHSITAVLFMAMMMGHM